MFLFLLIAPLGSFFGAITSVNQALGALGRIQEVLDLPDRDAGRRDDRGASLAERPRTGGRPLRDRAAAPRDRVPRRAVPLPRERRRGPRGKAESEALAVLENAHVDTLGVDLPEADDAREADRDVLRGVSFAVPRGARVALVGPSRRGQEHDARAHRALLRPDRRRDPARRARTSARSTASDLRAQLGYVEQDAPTLAGTIADNLRLGLARGIR